MKSVCVVLSLLFLSACSTPTIPDFEARMLTRTEVINGAEQCKDAEMRPFVEYMSQKTSYGRVIVPVNVHCNPIRDNGSRSTGTPSNVGNPIIQKYTVQ
jgi:hypothetical protein